MPKVRTDNMEIDKLYPIHIEGSPWEVCETINAWGWADRIISMQPYTTDHSPGMVCVFRVSYRQYHQLIEEAEPESQPVTQFLEEIEHLNRKIKKLEGDLFESQKGGKPTESQVSLI